MTVALVDCVSTMPVHRPMLLEALEAQPASPTLRIAVGFESDRSWISAQWGELAMRKDTRPAPLETIVHLCHGADCVRLDVRGAVVVVTKGTTVIECASTDAHPLMRALLASSAAVSTARHLREELLRRGEVPSPECALLSTVEFVHALMCGTAWEWFRDDEATWVEELREVRPRERVA
ncbi:MAG TPA: hypothetical protein VG106_11065 [Vicinamibacterales bacterium]|nr:hypothetical protein [Vicinamibacterales bacterium]